MDKFDSEFDFARFIVNCRRFYFIAEFRRNFLSIGLWFWLSFKESNKLNFARLSLTGGILFAILFFY